MATNTKGEDSGSGADSSAVRIVRLTIWPTVILILGLFALWYYHNDRVTITEVSVNKLLTIKFNLLAAEHDRLTSGVGSDGKSASSTSDVQSAAGVAKITAVADNAAKVELKGSRVLWVDDNPSNNTYEQKALSALGIEFDTALSTNEAMDKLEKTKFDLVISDFSRRDDARGGATLIEDLKKVANAPPIIIYSSGFTKSGEAELKKLGAFGETNQALTLFQMVIDALKHHQS